MLTATKSPKCEIVMVGEDEWDLTCPEAKRDFHIRKEQAPLSEDERGECWCIYEFVSTETDKDLAHADSSVHGSMPAAFKEVFDRVTTYLHDGY